MINMNVVGFLAVGLVRPRPCREILVVWSLPCVLFAAFSRDGACRPGRGWAGAVPGDATNALTRTSILCAIAFGKPSACRRQDATFGLRIPENEDEELVIMMDCSKATGPAAK